MKQPAVAPGPAQRLLNDREGSAYLGVSRSQFRELVVSGAIPRVRVPSGDCDGRPLRRLLVDRGDLDKLIERWKVR